MKAGDKILVAPLDWGLGHASRCVPIIEFLLQQNIEVIIGGGGESLLYLRNRFPQLTFVVLPTAKIEYGQKGMISLKFLSSMMRFARNIRQEHKTLEEIVNAHGINYVFSDNRLGLYSATAKTFYMTHQLNFDNGFLNPISAFFMKRLHRYYINRYDCCCVPDVKGEFSLSGILSQSEIPVKHLVPLSRFANKEFQIIDDDFDLLILSGVEPQRTIFENIMLEKYRQNASRKLIIVRGRAANDESLLLPENISYENNPTDNLLASLILSARVIFCRSGYSTLCDLAALKRRAVLVPTPKQPEQEYLAQYFNVKYKFPICKQEVLRDFVLDNEIVLRKVWNYDFVSNIGEIM